MSVALDEPAVLPVEAGSLTALVADPRARESIVRRVIATESSEDVLRVAGFQSFI